MTPRRFKRLRRDLGQLGLNLYEDWQLVRRAPEAGPVRLPAYLRSALGLEVVMAG